MDKMNEESIDVVKVLNMDEEALEANGFEYRKVRSLCIHCDQFYEVELLYAKDEPEGDDEGWQGVCDPCHKKLMD